MDFALMILLGLAIPIAWTAAFFISLGNRNRTTVLEQRFRSLEQEVLRLGSLPRASVAAAAGPAPDILREPAKPFVPDSAPREQASNEPPRTTPISLPTPQTREAPATSAIRTGPAVPPGAVPPTTVPPSPPVSTTPAAAPKGPGFEETIGTRWVVWVGGLALALGAIFLVRYSIEQGLIGPGTRIVLGGLFAAALIGAGEWLRRKDVAAGIALTPAPSIPAMLTAAGTTAAYATTWAAYGLYDFIAPGSAFILLGIVAMATLAAALLHGPALAGLGLVGAYVTPLLVSTKEPSFWALYTFLLVVTGAAFLLARIRLWRGLAIAAIAASSLWILPGLLGGAIGESATSHAFYAVGLFILASALIVSGFLFGPEPENDAVEPISSATLVAYLAVSGMVVLASLHAPVALIAFTLLCAGTIAVAWRAPSATAAVPVAAFLSALVIAEWAVTLTYGSAIAASGLATSATPPSNANTGMHLTLGALFALMFGGAGYFAQGRSERAMPPLMWAIGAVVAPVLILIALYYRIAGFERSLPFAGFALLLAALYATAVELLSKRPQRPGMPSAAAIFAVGAVASLALAMTMALEKGWLTIALALMAPGIAYISDKRPLPFLRWLAAACAVLVCARIFWNPVIVDNLGTTPIFNWLLWGYGVPAVSFWAAAIILRRRADDVPARMLDSAAILFTVLTVMLQIRHAINGGQLYEDRAPLAELGVQISALLAMAVGLERLRERTKSPVHNVGAILVALLALVLIVLGLFLVQNPLDTTVPMGGRFINLILLGYGMPALLAIALAIVARDTRPMFYRAIAAGTAVALALMYLTLQTRRLFVGEVLSLRDPTLWPSDAELWAYSAVWLVFGVLLLLIGIWLRSQPARLASALVILITVAKVFLLDLAGIGGIWRSLSFIGLGLVLVGIGLLYQRLLFPPRPRGMIPTPPPDAEPPAALPAVPAKTT